ncbi:hypothetical protein [Sulfitobacter sp. 1A12779]
MAKRKEGDPYFTWKDYVFGKNMGAATLQILLGIGAFSVVFLIFAALFG